MTNIETTMYTLGQLARAIWPDGRIPSGLLNNVLRQPASGLAAMMRTPAARRARKLGDVNVIRYMGKLPADLADPPGGVKIEDQGPFWVGWYQHMTAIERSGRYGPVELERIGQLLFGERWQSETARALGVGDRRVREWISSQRRPPAGVWADLAALLRQRQQEGLALLREMDRKAG